MTNAINPSHYKSDTIECIDAMKACSTPEEFRGHLKLTVLKYLWREDKKGEGDQARVENLEKAAWYLERLVKDLRNETTAKIANFESAMVSADRVSRISPVVAFDGDGWISWGGGDDPCHGRFVDTIDRDGTVIFAVRSTKWDWDHDGSDDDIIFYRVHK